MAILLEAEERLYSNSYKEAKCLIYNETDGDKELFDAVFKHNLGGGQLSRSYEKDRDKFVDEKARTQQQEKQKQQRQQSVVSTGQDSAMETIVAETAMTAAAAAAAQKLDAACSHTMLNDIDRTENALKIPTHIHPVQI